MLQFPVSCGATWLTCQHSSGSGQCGVCRLKAGSTQKSFWELRLSAWRNINVVLDMSHQTPFPNELRKWSTIWPHLQHLSCTNILQPHVEVRHGGTALRNRLKPPGSGDCSVLGSAAVVRAGASVPAGSALLAGWQEGSAYRPAAVKTPVPVS